MIFFGLMLFVYQNFCYPTRTPIGWTKWTRKFFINFIVMFAWCLLSNKHHFVFWAILNTHNGVLLVYEQLRDQFEFLCRNAYLTFINSLPSKFSPQDGIGLFKAVSFENPIPQILSYGLASTIIKSSVSSKSVLRDVENFDNKTLNILGPLTRDQIASS